MRELTRFRREFNEVHSLRSKILASSAICKQVTNLIKSNEKTIIDDLATLDVFSCKKQRLFMRR